MDFDFAQQPAPLPPVSRRRTLALALISLSSTLMPGAAFGQATDNWPSKPIRLVLPSGPGGGTDIFGRNLADYLSRQLNVPVVVDNKPGAVGIVAHEAVVRLPPDGYNLVVSFSGAVLGNKAMLTPMRHDPMTDLQPIARISGQAGNLLIVNADLPVHNIKELVAYAKSQPGKLSYASWGVGSGGHLAMEVIKLSNGIDLSHVPYKTVASIPPDVVSGVLPIATIDSATPLPLIKSGRLRAIAVLGASRLPQLPDVKTLAEQGVPYDLTVWQGLFGPAHLPSNIVRRLNTLVNQWLVLPETKAFFEEKQNTPAPVPVSPEAFAALIQRELPIWLKQVHDANAGSPAGG